MLHWLLLKLRILLKKVWRISILVFRTGGKLSKYPPFVIRFEQDFANYVGATFGMSFCNGTAALEASLFAVGVKAGDEVMVNSCSIHATAAAILSLGAQPVYVDLDPKTLLFDPSEIARKTTSRT